MDKLKISLIAFPGAPKKVFEQGEKILMSKFKNVDIQINTDNSDALFVLTGGSEKQAQQLLKGLKRVLILAVTSNNSYAAATEIKSYCNDHHINAVLYNVDYENNLQEKIYNYIKSIQALKKISNYKIGLIGNVSEWLINSDIKPDILQNKWGIEVQKIVWSEYPEYSSFEDHKSFSESFKTNENFDLTDSSKVYNLLNHIITKNKLDAITVECFPLVRQHAVTACLALSKFNTDRFPAGCEGDMTSVIGKIITKELTGKIPWMANLAAIEESKVLLAHCTIATDLVEEYTIKTHFETNEGTAVQGQFKAKEVTIFRLNNLLNKAFISFGMVTDTPKRNDACRTQIMVNTENGDTQKLKENPLGNHHLVIPGNHLQLLHYFCFMNQIEVL